MERLTEYIDGRYIAVQKRVSGNIIGDKDCYNRLGEYENTGLTPEEIKHLHKLTKIEVGQTVYVLTRYGCNKVEIIECRVNRKTIKNFYIFSVTGRYANGNYYKGTFREDSIGKTVFTTREEAERL